MSSEQLEIVKERYVSGDIGDDELDTQIEQALRGELDFKATELIIFGGATV